MFETPAHNIPYLFAAFAIAWAVFFIYAFVTSRKQDELERELASLQDQMRRRESGGGES